MSSKRFSPALAGQVLLLSATSVYALDGWRIEPLLDAQFWASDNIGRASSGNEESGSFASIEPGVSIQRESGRLDFDFAYKMIATVLSDGVENDVFHRGDLSANYEVLPDRFFIDASGTYTQSLVDAEADFGNDIYSAPNAFTNVANFRLSPIWRENFSGYADFIARYDAEVLRYGRGRSDVDRHRIGLSLENGRRVDRLLWRFEYDRENQRYHDAVLVDDIGQKRVTRERFYATLGYALNNVWQLAARAGYENNDDIAVDGDDIPDGTVWSVGARWIPSEFFEATALVGPDDKELSFEYAPSTRTALKLTWNDRNIGASAGSDWSASFTHRTRYSQWTARYSEGLVIGGLADINDAFVTFSNVLVSDTEDDVSTNAVFNDQGQLGRIEPTVSLTGGDFRRKVLSAGVRFEKARTEVETVGFYEKRQYSESTDQQSLGAATKLTRHLGPRTAATLAIDWEQAEFSTAQEDTVWNTQALISHAFSRDFGIGVGYRYVDRASSVKGRDFSESRLGALMRMKF